MILYKPAIIVITLSTEPSEETTKQVLAEAAEVACDTGNIYADPSEVIH